jgi:hypothetical protein
MRGLTSGPATMHGFVRSAIILAACILAAALLLTPVALRLPGSGSISGLAVAAAICLLSGLVAEGTSSFVARTSPLAASLVGMMVRMILPLGVCAALLASGQNGRQHLAFIDYLLAFYMITLALETWLAVKRTASPASTSNQSSR